MIADPLEAAGVTAATVAAYRDTIANETAAALLAGDALVRLRDERLAPALGARDTAALIARDLPSLDRRSARILVGVADVATAIGPDAAAAAGLARLAAVAAAHPLDRADVTGVLDQMPPGYLRHTLRDSRDARLAADRRAGVALTAPLAPWTPSGPWTETRSETECGTVARALLGMIERAWREQGSATFAAARLLAKLGDEHGPRLPAFVERELGLDRADAARDLVLVERLGDQPIALRERIGIGACRALAALDAPERRAAILAAAAADPTIVGDAVIDRCGRPVAPDETAPSPDAGPSVDETALLAPFDLVFLSDLPPDGRPPFGDPTAPGLARQVVLRASRRGELVLDLTAGSGTVTSAATALGRRAIGYDIIEPPLDPAIRVGDAATIRPAEGLADLVVFHPPLPGGPSMTERYGERARAADLAIHEPSSYARRCGEILEHAFGLVRPGGKLVIIAASSRHHGRQFDWPGRLTALAEGAGFVLVDRLYAAASPAERHAAQARRGLVAARDGLTITTTTTASILARPARGGTR